MDPDDVAAAAAGDSAAWQRIVEQHTGLVWTVARSFRLDRHDAEDVAQSTWERCARSLADIREPERLGAWLATTTRREALRVVELRRRTTPSADFDWIGPDRAEAQTPEQTVVDRHAAADRAAYGSRAWALLEKLPGGCRELLRVLLSSPPPSYAEAAAALGRPIGAIGPSRRRCLEQLRTRLENSVSADGPATHD